MEKTKTKQQPKTESEETLFSLCLYTRSIEKTDIFETSLDVFIILMLAIVLWLVTCIRRLLENIIGMK